MNTNTMIIVQSYLRDEQHEFIAVEQATNAPKDHQYIEGAIELTINGTVILDKALWDYVDQLWAYIAEMIRKIKADDTTASTHFPDQPVKLTFERHGDNIHITCKINDEIRTAQAPATELLQALKQAGSTFFATLIQLVPQNHSAYEAAMHTLAIQ